MRLAVVLFALTHTLAAQTASLRGIVTDALTHRPLENAQIQVGPRDKPLLATSGINGEYYVSQIPPGRTFLEITKEGYSKLGVISNPAEAILDFKVGDRLQRNFELQPGSSVRGRLLDRDTDLPIPGLRVQALQENYGMGSKRYIPIATSQPSTEAGEFKIDALRPGDYFIEIRQAKLPKVTSVADPPTPNKKRYPPSYFPGVPRLEMAAPLTLGTADHRTLDLHLVSGGLRSISGEIEALKGTGRISVVVEKEKPGSFTMIASGSLTAPGHFHIDDLSEGNFTILIFTQGPDNPQFLEYPIEIANRDLEDIKLRLIPALTVKGSAQSAKATGDLPPTKLTFELDPIRRIRVENDGAPTTFPAPGLFERPKVLAGIYYPTLTKLPQGWAVAEVRFEGATLPYGTAIPIDGRAIDPSLNFILTNKLGAATGTIRDSNGNPVLGVKMVVLPYPIPELFNTFAIRIENADAQGNFTFQSLPPGKYKAIPLTGNAAKSDRDLTALREKATLLDPFEVQAGQIAALSVKP